MQTDRQKYIAKIKYKTSAEFGLDTCCNDYIFVMSSPIFNARRVLRIKFDL